MTNFEKFCLFTIGIGWMLISLFFMRKGMFFMDIAIKYLERH
jgi:hypothetical protein